MSLRRSEIFPTPIWEDVIADRQLLLKAGAIIRGLQAGDTAGLQVSNQGGWHSATDLHCLPELSPLFHQLAACILGAVEDLEWDLTQVQPVFNNAWAIINGPGDSNRCHLHPNSLISGVLYLDCPPSSGAIRFLDPRMGAQMLQPPLRTRTGLLCGEIMIPPKMGKLLLFPSWLWHEVEPSRSPLPRMCISFNVGMRPVRG